MSNRFSKLMENSRFLFFLSFLIALALWAYVSVYSNNDHTTVIKNVPINMQYKQSSYQALGLDVIETDIQMVNVSVTGPRSVTGELTADDIIVYPNVTGVDGAGKYTLTLTAEKTSSVKNFSINSMSHDSITVRLDRLISKELTVELNISTIVVAGEYMSDKPFANPSKITITGPEYKISTVAKAVAATITQETLTQTTVLPAEIQFYDEGGNRISDEYIGYDEENVEITIPLLKEVILPVKVEYVNAPQGFDTATLHQSLSQTEIRLAVPSQLASSLSEFVVGYIDLATLETDKQYVFEVKLPSGYRSMDEVSHIYATISSSNLTERTVSVSEIKVINDASESIKVLTQIINNVVVVGEKSEVEALSSGGVIAQIDASKLSAAQGQQSVEVSFIIPASTAAYVKGVYTVTIRI